MTERAFTAELWLHDAMPGAWHFITLPGDLADDLRARTAGERRGFGSLRVHATIGRTRWDTSVFPDTGTASYLLPVKAAVRRAERLTAGDRVGVRLRLAEPR